MCATTKNAVPVKNQGGDDGYDDDDVKDDDDAGDDDVGDDDGDVMR